MQNQSAPGFHIFASLPGLRTEDTLAVVVVISVRSGAGAGAGLGDWRQLLTDLEMQSNLYLLGFTETAQTRK